MGGAVNKTVSDLHQTEIREINLTFDSTDDNNPMITLTNVNSRAGYTTMGLGAVIKPGYLGIGGSTNSGILSRYYDAFSVTTEGTGSLAKVTIKINNYTFDIDKAIELGLLTK